MIKTLLFLYFALLAPLAFCSASTFESHLIIIGGGTTYQDAVVAKDQYMQHDQLQRLIETEVEVVLSDSITGLNPLASSLRGTKQSFKTEVNTP